MQTIKLNQAEYATVNAALEFFHAHSHKEDPDFNCSSLAKLADSLTDQLGLFIAEYEGKPMPGTLRLGFKFEESQAVLVVSALNAFRGQVEGGIDSGVIPASMASKARNAVKRIEEVQVLFAPALN